MTEHASSRRAEPVHIEHSGRGVDAFEWSADNPQATIVIAVDGDVPDVVGPVADELTERNRVIGLSLNSKWDPLTIAWWSMEPIILVAQGDAGRIACDTVRLAPGSVRALVLADYAPEIGSSDYSGLVVPVLVFHGRASSAETHAQAVKLHDEIPGSHLIEPDNCAELPTKNCPTVLAESLTWFLDELGSSYMEFDQFTGSGSDPIDPKA